MSFTETSPAQPPTTQFSSTAHHRWTATLQTWRTKQTEYQTALAATTNPQVRSQLQLGLATCEDMLQTCQDLLQVLDHTQQHLTLPPEVQGNTQPSTISPPSPVVLPLATASSTQQQPDEYRSPTVQPIRQHQPHRLGKILFPVVLIALAFFSIFRPRNVCKIAPDNTYQPDGLALWVVQTLQANATVAPTLKTVYVAQTGCTIQLKGTVPNETLRTEIVTLTQTLEVPSQTLVARLLHQFQLQEPNRVQPVKKVEVELTIRPD